VLFVKSLAAEGAECSGYAWIPDKSETDADAKSVTASGFASFSIVVALRNTYALTAFLLSIVSAITVALGTIPATIVVAWSPEMAEVDFEQKGTLSNTTQKAEKPHGRLWAVALFTASMLKLNSMYTLWLYRPWLQPTGEFVAGAQFHTIDYVRTNILSHLAPRAVSTVWAILPHVGFLFTAVVPSLSGAHGYQTILLGVHNVCAPISMLFLMAMETIQLQCGEQAFSYFSSDDNVPGFNEPLCDFQRLRVITVVAAWISGLVFVSVQGYLAFVPNKSYTLALVSYFGEVIGLILAFWLPVLAGLDIIFWNSTQPAAYTAAKFMSTFDFPIMVADKCHS